MDLTMLLRAFYLSIELLVVKENVLYMSFYAILMHKKKQIHGSGTDFKESFKLFETITLWIINRYQLSYLYDYFNIYLMAFMCFIFKFSPLNQIWFCWCFISFIWNIERYNISNIILSTKMVVNFISTY